MNVYKMSAITLNTVLIKGITNSSIDPRIQTWINRGGGSPYPSFISGQEKRPLASFTTTDIKTVLDLTGAGPIAVGTVCDFYAAKLAHGASFTSGSAHQKYTLNDGMIVPRRIRASHRSEATIDVDIIATYDGTNDPLTYTGSQALPANYNNVTEKFTAGPVYLTEEAAFVETKSWDYNFGVNEFTDGHSGEPFDRFVAMTTMNAMANVTTLDLGVFDTIGSNGQASGAVLFLRKLTEGSIARVADATAEHIGITFEDGFIYPGAISGGDGEASFSFTIAPSFDGTNAIAVIDTTSAIAGA